MPATDSTVHAIWTINQYTVSFDTHGGSSVTSITQDFASIVTLPAAPMRTGYTFSTWNTVADGSGTAYASGDTFSMPASDLTIHAIWTINQYSVTYDTQGGSSVPPVTQDYNTPVTLPGAPDRDGYTFVDWNTAADGTGTYYAAGQDFPMPAHDSTIYAIWTINQYTVSFDTHGGSVVAAITQDFASTVTLPAAPTRTGYTFSTWNMAADGSGTAYAPGATFAMPANDSTIHAIWSNTAPLLAMIEDVVMNEDGAVTVLVSLSDAESPSAALSVSATSAQPAVLPNPTVGVVADPAQRELLLTPVPDANGGPVTVTVVVTDEAGSSSQRTFTVTVRAVNDAPTFTTTGNRTETSGATGLRTVPGFIQSLSVGPADESTQFILGYSVVQLADPNHVVSSIAVAVDGTLSYTLTGAGGTANFEIRATDNGGSAYGGQPTSNPVAFSITVANGADLQVSLSNGRSYWQPGESVLYDLYVANAGPSDVTGATLTTTIPAELTDVAWTCTVILGGTCPQATGTGAVGATLNLPAGAVIRYSIIGTIAPTLVDRPLVASATIAPPSGMAELNPANNTDTDNDVVLVEALFLDGFEDGVNRISVPGFVWPPTGP